MNPKESMEDGESADTSRGGKGHISAATFVRSSADVEDFCEFVDHSSLTLCNRADPKSPSPKRNPRRYPYGEARSFGHPDISLPIKGPPIVTISDEFYMGQNSNGPLTLNENMPDHQDVGSVDSSISSVMTRGGIAQQRERSERTFRGWLLEDLPRLHSAYHIIGGSLVGFVSGWGAITIGRLAAFCTGIFMAAVVIAKQTGYLEIDVRQLRRRATESAMTIRSVSRQTRTRDMTEMFYEFCRANSLLCSCCICGFCFGLSFG